jgi:predicted lipoprotein with Yx(FWY)xxD motif
MHTRTIVLALALLLLGATGTTSDASPAPTVTAGRSAYGVVLFDGHGKALYAFTRDRHGPSRCSGACAAAWPPYIAGDDPRAGAGADSSLLHTIRRADGRQQVTYAGRPLYYYAGDRKPGQILCQNVSEYGGLWLVVRPNGRLVR